MVKNILITLVIALFLLPILFFKVADGSDSLDRYNIGWLNLIEEGIGGYDRDYAESIKNANPDRKLLGVGNVPELYYTEVTGGESEDLITGLGWFALAIVYLVNILIIVSIARYVYYMVKRRRFANLSRPEKIIILSIVLLELALIFIQFTGIFNETFLGGMIGALILIAVVQFVLIPLWVMDGVMLPVTSGGSGMLFLTPNVIGVILLAVLHILTIVLLAKLLSWGYRLVVKVRNYIQAH